MSVNSSKTRKLSILQVINASWLPVEGFGGEHLIVELGTREEVPERTMTRKSGEVAQGSFHLGLLALEDGDRFAEQLLDGAVRRFGSPLEGLVLGIGDD